MRIAFGTDEATPTTDAVRAHLARAGHDVVTVVPDGTAWTEVGRAVGDVVVGGGAGRGIVCCWTGTGVSMAANKVAGVRAALCGDAETAAGARRWNDANVLALSLRLTTPAVAEEIVDAFLATGPDPDEADRIAELGEVPGVPKYVMLSTLGPDGSARLRENPERLREVSAEVEAMGVRVLEQFAVLGQWDFINILEAPDEVTMARVATALGSRGTLKTLTMPLVEIEPFIEALKRGM